MNKNLAFFLAMLTATGAFAQAPALTTPGDTSTPPAAAPATPPPTMETLPAPATKKPAAKPKPKPAAKPVAKKPAAEAPGAPFTTNEVAVAKQNNINVRAQSHINSEIITKLKEGETVTVMKEITLSKPKTDEPARWVQIALPDTAHAWVSTSFLGGGQTVTSTKLNVRSGAGENYSVIGLLHKGDTVKIVSTKGDWTEIEAPTGSYGFVAAHLLDHKPVAPPPPPVVTQNIAANPPPAIAPANLPPQRPTPVIPEIPTPAPAPQFVTETPAVRIVQREGTVGGTVSIQAPTYFQLESLETGKAIDYLFSSSTNLVLDHWMGRRVLVTGEESLDERWPKTPVLTIQKIQVVK